MFYIAAKGGYNNKIGYKPIVKPNMPDYGAYSETVNGNLVYYLKLFSQIYIN